MTGHPHRDRLRFGAALGDAWQAALAGEQRAVFGYGVLGPHLPVAEQTLALACSGAHESLRDTTSAALTVAGLTPVAPQVDYPELYPVTDARGAGLTAARLEDGCAAAWRFLYARAAGSRPRSAQLRSHAQDALTASAVRATRWRRIVDPTHATTPFPGIASS